MDLRWRAMQETILLETFSRGKDEVDWQLNQPRAGHRAKPPECLCWIRQSHHLA